MLVTSIIAHDKSNVIPILNLSMKSENAGDQHNSTSFPMTFSKALFLN